MRFAFPILHTNKIQNKQPSHIKNVISKVMKAIISYFLFLFNQNL